MKLEEVVMKELLVIKMANQKTWTLFLCISPHFD